MSRSHWKFHKKDIENLLATKAGLGREELKCARETGELIMCWSSSSQKSADPRCKPLESALRRCEITMGNNVAAKARAEVKRTLIFQLLRFSNKRDKSAATKNLS